MKMAYRTGVYGMNSETIGWRAVDWFAGVNIQGRMTLINQTELGVLRIKIIYGLPVWGRWAFQLKVRSAWGCCGVLGRRWGLLHCSPMASDTLRR